MSIMFMKENNYEILLQRKEMRNKIPYKKSKNQMLHMDLTTIEIRCSYLDW